MKRQHSRQDVGLTLTELLITVAITGIVVSVLASSTILFMRNQDSAGNRVDQSRGLQQLVNYLTGDVASAQLVGEELSVFDCPFPGVAKLELDWAEVFDGDVVRTRVSYRQVGPRLVRHTCTQHQGLRSSSVEVASNLVDVDVDVELNAENLPSGRVNMTLIFPDARRTISATSWNMEN